MERKPYSRRKRTTTKSVLRLPTELQCCAVGLISNPVNLHLAPSIYVAVPCAGLHTRPPTAFSAAPIWRLVFAALKA